MPKFSERLKLLRNQRNLSQQELSKQLGVLSKSSINMYERGEREPGLETLELIADFFNVDMDYLLGKSDIPNRSAELMSLNDFLTYISMESTSGRAAAKEEMYRSFGKDHCAAEIRLLGDEVALLYYKAMDRDSAAVLQGLLMAVEDLGRDDIENVSHVVRAYLRAGEPIKKIVDTALQPYREEDL